MSYDIDLLVPVAGGTVHDAAEANFEGTAVLEPGVDLRSVGARLVELLPPDAEVRVSAGAVSGFVSSWGVSFDLDQSSGGQLNLPLAPTPEVWEAALRMVAAITATTPFLAFDAQREIGL